MSQNHAFHIEKLKADFDNIISLKKEIAKIKNIINEKLTLLKLQYNELIKSNQKKIILFCLDSFYFQYKTFTMELEHIDKYRSLMNNRMYCDYYKLYNIIVSFIKDNKADLELTDIDAKTYTTYKDLEPFQEYRLDDIKDIHANILVLINKLYMQSTNKTDKIEHYVDNHKIGYSISNFLNTLGYENRILQEQITLYINYLSFFQISEKRHLNRLLFKIQEFNKDIEESINGNTTYSIDDIKQEESVHRFITDDEEITINNILEDNEFLPKNESVEPEQTQTLVPQPAKKLEEPLIQFQLDTPVPESAQAPEPQTETEQAAPAESEPPQEQSLSEETQTEEQPPSE
jgi:hypothetical protein